MQVRIHIQLDRVIAMLREAHGVGLLMCIVLARGMEPLAPLAAQPVWQAGKPVKVEVDYDGTLAPN